jgi:hypothetical protein
MALTALKNYTYAGIRAAVSILLLGSGVLAAGCQDERIEGTFTDDFNRDELGPNYRDTIGRYVVHHNRLNVARAYNHPLWLKRRLPRNVVIEFDATAYTKDGDIKVELYGDGRSFDDRRGAYKGTGYIICLGAWKNTKSFIARQIEHPPKGREREFMAVRKDFRVQTGRTYHFKIVRRGQEIQWDLDGQPFLSFVDRRPLWGKDHDHFAFNNWESEVSFDNLVIRALD